MTKKLSHIDDSGLPSMVDVGSKQVTERLAIAGGRISLGIDVMATLTEGGFNTKKGSILQTAIIAGTMAVKNTFATIPLCHQIPISSCRIEIEPEVDGFEIICTVKTNAQTGIEMEALHGVSVAALTIYDMCKAITQNMVIGEISLLKKTGGKHDYER